MSDLVCQRCINPDCNRTLGIDDTTFVCPQCGGLVDVSYDWDKIPSPPKLQEFTARWAERSNPLNRSGVWRFRELLPFAPAEKVVTLGEGQTILQQADGLTRYIGMQSGKLFLQYEGLNPSGSFKDNGMSAAFTHARMTGAKRAACASTGNTSASLALFCAATSLMRAVIFVGSGKISYGKLSQALDHGALTIQVVGDFDDAMQRVQQVSRQLGIYLVNSINPFRLEGQKSVMFRVLEGLSWEIPDWIVVPGGNLGNVSAFGKAFIELRQLGLINKVPRFAVINAAGACTFYQLFEHYGLRWNEGRPDQSKINNYYAGLDAQGMRASTLASAIEINRPVNLLKALRTLEACGGVVREANDQEILDAKAQVGAHGFGCEPASAASVAGAKILRQQGVIEPGERVVCILTAHQLKDPTATVAYHGSDAKNFDEVLGKRGVRTAPFANRPVQVSNDLKEIIEAIESHS